MVLLYFKMPRSVLIRCTYFEGDVMINLRGLLFNPCTLCKTEVHLNIPEQHKTLSFSVRKKLLKIITAW